MKRPLVLLFLLFGFGLEAQQLSDDFEIQVFRFREALQLEDSLFRAESEAALEEMSRLFFSEQLEAHQKSDEVDEMIQLWGRQIDEIKNAAVPSKRKKEALNLMRNFFLEELKKDKAFVREAYSQDRFELLAMSTVIGVSPVISYISFLSFRKLRDFYESAKKQRSQNKRKVSASSLGRTCILVLARAGKVAKKRKKGRSFLKRVKPLVISVASGSAAGAASYFFWLDDNADYHRQLHGLEEEIFPRLKLSAGEP